MVTESINDYDEFINIFENKANIFSVNFGIKTYYYFLK